MSKKPIILKEEVIDVIETRLADFVDKYSSTRFVIKFYSKELNTICRKNTKIDLFIDPFKGLSLREDNTETEKEIIENLEFIKKYFSFQLYRIDFSFCPKGSCYPLKCRFIV